MVERLIIISDNLTQILGVPPNIGTGVAGTGTLRVAVSTDSSITIIGTVDENLKQINGVTASVGNGISGTGVLRVTLASDSTGQVTLAAGANIIGSLTANQSVNVAQMNGVAVSMGTGVMGTGVQRVAIASNNDPLAVTQSGAWSLSANQSVNVAQMNGIATTMNNGVAGTGVQRVCIASDNTAFSVNATLQTGANTIGALTANQSVNNTQINGVAISTGTGVMGTGVQRVAIASNNDALAVTGTFWQATQPVSGTVSIAANQSVNVAQINGVTTTMGNGVSGTGVQRVTLASDSTGQVALAAGAAVIGALTANQSVNIAQMNGVAVTMGSGVIGTGVQRVVIATDQPAFAVTTSAVIPKNTYIGTSLGYTPPIAPTNMIVVQGSGTKTVKIHRIRLWVHQTAAAFQSFNVNTYSTAPTGQTAVNDAFVPCVISGTAATATIQHYTANSTGGASTTGGGTLITATIFVDSAVSSLSGTETHIDLFQVTDLIQPITLVGTANCCAINFGGAALPAGLNISAEFIITEE